MLRNMHDLLYGRDFLYLHNQAGDFFAPKDNRVYKCPEDVMKPEELDLYYNYTKGEFGMVTPFVARLLSQSPATMALTVEFYADENDVPPDVTDIERMGEYISSAICKDVYMEVIGDRDDPDLVDLVVIVPYEKREEILPMAQQITRLVERYEGEDTLTILRRKLKEQQERYESADQHTEIRDVATLWKIKAATVKETLDLIDDIEKGGVA